MPEPLYNERPLMFAAQPLRFTISCALVVAGLVAAFHVPWLFYPGIALAVVSGLTLAWWALDNAFTSVEVTDERITHNFGVFNRACVEVERSSIRTVRVTQSLVDRIFGCGYLHVISGGDAADIMQDGLPDIARLRTAMRSVQRV